MISTIWPDRLVGSSVQRRQRLLAATHHQAKDGVWNYFVALWRPAGFRFQIRSIVFSTIRCSDVDFCRPACWQHAAWFAATGCKVARNLGRNCIFRTDIYLRRTFAPTVYTSRSHCSGALLSIPFFIEAFRRGSVKPALVGVRNDSHGSDDALGSMFTIPALLVWLSLAIRTGHGSKT